MYIIVYAIFYKIKILCLWILIEFYWSLEWFTSVSSLILPLRTLGKLRQSPPSANQNRPLPKIRNYCLKLQYLQLHDIFKIIRIFPY